MLSTHRIAELASMPKVMKVAVENFLSSLYDTSQADALMNAALDAKMYGWNEHTVRAIQLGIYESHLDR